MTNKKNEPCRRAIADHDFDHWKTRRVEGCRVRDLGLHQLPNVMIRRDSESSYRLSTTVKTTIGGARELERRLC